MKPARKTKAPAKAKRRVQTVVVGDIAKFTRYSSRISYWLVVEKPRDAAVRCLWAVRLPGGHREKTGWTQVGVASAFSGADLFPISHGRYARALGAEWRAGAFR